MRPYTHIPGAAYRTRFQGTQTWKCHPHTGISHASEKGACATPIIRHHIHNWPTWSKAPDLHSFLPSASFMLRVSLTANTSLAFLLLLNAQDAHALRASWNTSLSTQNSPGNERSRGRPWPHAGVTVPSWWYLFTSRASSVICDLFSWSVKFGVRD